MTMDMRGPRGICHAVSDHLASGLPAWLASLRVEWALDTLSLPDPIEYKPREPKSLDQFPLVATVCVNDRAVSRIDYTNAAEPQYLWIYTMRTYAWVKHEGQQEVQDMRDDLATAIRLFFLRAATFGAGGDANARIEETTLATDYSDAVKVKGERWVAGAYVGYEVRANQTVGTLTAETQNTVQTTSAQAQPI